MVALDAPSLNIAVPSAPQDLGRSDGRRQWVIAAYALAFGGLRAARLPPTEAPAST